MSCTTLNCLAYQPTILQSNLSSSMDELVPLFLSVTNTTDEATAKQYLELTAGNLDYAVTLFMESHPPLAADTINGGNSHVDDEEMARKLQEEAYGDNVREADANVHKHETLVDGFGFQPSMTNFNRPTDIFGNGRVGIFNQRFDDEENEYYQQRFEDLEDDEEEEDDEEDDEDIIIIDSDVEEEDEEDNRPPVSRRNRMRQERQAQLTSTQRRLANLFRPPFDLMTVADIDTAKRKGKEEKKWLLVNIQDPGEFQSQVLNRDFWSNSLIKSIVKQNFVFLQYQNNSPNGINYINFYHPENFPHIAILDSWTGERLKCWKDGEVPDVQTWSQEVEEFLSEFSLNPNVQNPMVKHQAKFDPDSLTEEQQIEFAIKHSLASNGNSESDVVNLDDDEEDEIEIEDTPEVDNEPKDPFTSIIAQEHVEPQESATRIQIRFPNGKRLVHKFALNDTILTIFQWLKYVIDNNLEDYGLQSGDHFTLSNSSNRAFKFIDSLNATVEESNLKNASILLEKD